MMGGGAGLHPDQTGRLLLEEWQYLAAPEPPADHGLTRAADTADLKDALREINPDRGNFCHRTAPS